MNGWRLSGLYFYSRHGKRRDLTFNLRGLTVISGSSGTGKSAVLEAVDYVLGASKWHLPALIKWRCSAIGCLWVNEDASFFAGRLVPRGAAASVSRFFLEVGRSIAIPEDPESFRGETDLKSGVREMSRLFGIGDTMTAGADSDGAKNVDTVSIRHAMPYIFLSKEVIDSKKLLFHGFDDAQKVSGYQAALPYFLGAVSEETVAAERKLRQLRRAFAAEQERTKRLTAEEEVRVEKARQLVVEASTVGLVPQETADAEPQQVMAILRSALGLSEGVRGEDYAVDSVLPRLYEQKTIAEGRLRNAYRRKRSAQETEQVRLEIDQTLSRQAAKAKVFDYLRIDQMSEQCPVCSSRVSHVSTNLRKIKAGVEKIKAESGVLAAYSPKLRAYVEEVDREIVEARSEVAQVDRLIAAAVRQVDEKEEIQSQEAVYARVRGRISYFLEEYTQGDMRTSIRAGALKREIEQLEGAVDPELKESRLRWAENQISQEATKLASALPRKEPMDEGGLQFVSKQPDVKVQIPRRVRGLSLPEIGSDQNYLTLHMALYLSMHEFFRQEDAAVPRVIFADQISRPFFPKEDKGEEKEMSDDEEFATLRTYVQFLIDYLRERPEQQFILIEKAYFGSIPEYVKATQERWNRETGIKLIPDDWPDEPGSQRL